VRWQVRGPVTKPSEAPGDSRVAFAAGMEGRVAFESGGAKQGTWFTAQTATTVLDQTEVEFLASSNSSYEIYLNGKSIHQRAEPQNARDGFDRISATLAKGTNRLMVAVKWDAPEKPLEFRLRFRKKSSSAEREKLAAAALARSGNPERGRAIFLNVEKSLCIKCHRLGDQGERVGPELTGLGSRFSRIHIVESILEPSRGIAPSFGTVVAVLNSGKVVSGIKVAETETTLTLVDNQGQKQVVAKDDIEEQKPSPLSTMPDGLEKRLTENEFVDLVAFLASQ
jgi:putative heme-binding domain-containing protein